MSSTELDATVAEVLDRATHLKQELVKVYGVGEPFPLMIELRRDGVELGTVFAGGTRRVLTLLTMAIALSDADNALLVGEAFSYHAERRPDRMPYGQLARWFAEGDPDTHECIQVLSAHRDGRVHLAQHTFHHEGRRVVWDQLYTYGQTPAGKLTKHMSNGFRMQRDRPFAALSVSAIADVLTCDASVPQLPEPARNAECPCGSGRKARRCCWSS